LSEAVALSVTVLLTVLPLLGAVNETVGAVVSATGLFTITLLLADIVELPAVSKALEL
jgi:hypothetical protein